ncbi:MAG: hypothetical protein RIB41_10150 [Oceanibaculum nanhaiense]|uniref:hypothetical protein n=1 Tax=Oceanibaculum nanhaiense TaxID=1909734 RepID=UPI0032EB0460
MLEADDPEVRRLREEALARQAAEMACKKVFAILGVDLGNAAQVEEFRRDLRFGQAMRKVAEKGVTAGIVVVVGGILAALWVGLQMKLGGK